MKDTIKIQQEKTRAFYFTKNRRLRYDDNRQITVGEKHSVDGELELCGNGLHASWRLIDALRYAPGGILYLVELGGEVLEDKDKLCARERTYLAEFDATDLLRDFARKQALINIEKIKPYCSEVNYDLILRWLKEGKDRDKSEAESAARSAAESVVWSAAEAAAWSAARSAARSAAESAAESAAWTAAEAASWLAARSAVRSAAESAAESVVWSAAEAAAWLAARSAANETLTEMVKQSTGWEI